MFQKRGPKCCAVIKIQYEIEAGRIRNIFPLMLMYKKAMLY